MKKSLIFVIFAFVSVISFGQNSLAMGKTQLNFGLGLSDWGVPVYFGFDYAVSSDITLGSELSYRSYHEDVNNTYYDHSIEGVSGNFNYHFNNLLSIPQNWDVYAGLNIGFYIWNSPDTYGGSHSSGLGLGAQIGGRYFISKRVALNLEFGGENTFADGKFGLTVQL
ncbi:hypothetical protein FHX64_002140 [Microbacter margulisiae]|uniref:Outer membrane protein beta-barrel domain-containing protein n=2 Tax=Microbacter margulisiae TaxID=1350067 RepID=A0A7W5DRV6_9PORP|nr:hypothetical protein [Microbacter margulisiae]